MPEVLMNKHKHVGTSYAEMPQDGRRFRFTIEKYRTDDGEEFGQVVSMEEIPDIGPYLWIPSWGTESAESTYLFEEYQSEPPRDAEYMAEHRAKQAKRMNDYNELRDERAKRIARKSKVLTGGK